MKQIFPALSFLFGVFFIVTGVVRAFDGALSVVTSGKMTTLFIGLVGLMLMLIGVAMSRYEHHRV